MIKVKFARCAFVVIKLQFEGDSYYLMRQDLDWKDVTFIGGHLNKKDNGYITRGAKRELIEELPALRNFKGFELTTLTDDVPYGPVYSHSAKCQVKYNFRFFRLKFTASPKPVIESVRPRSLNIFVRERDLLETRRFKVANLVFLLDRCIAGGLQSIPLSWSMDLAKISNFPFPSKGQFELVLE